MFGKIKFSVYCHSKWLFPNIKSALLRWGLLLSKLIKTIGKKDSREKILSNESFEWEQLFGKIPGCFGVAAWCTGPKWTFIFWSLINCWTLILSLIDNSALMLTAACGFWAHGDFIPLGQISVQGEQNCGYNWGPEEPRARGGRSESLLRKAEGCPVLKESMCS